MSKRGRPRPAEEPVLVKVRLISRDKRALDALTESLRLVATVQSDSGNRTGRKPTDGRLRYIDVIVKVRNEDTNE